MSSTGLGEERCQHWLLKGLQTACDSPAQSGIPRAEQQQQQPQAASETPQIKFTRQERRSEAGLGPREEAAFALSGDQG